MKVLVIIVSYNFEKWINRCLGSLRKSEQPADIVVIDNASQDNSVRVIQENYPEVRLVQSKTNLGFGRANNIGMKIALTEGYDYVFLLNQDAWIDNSTLGTLARLCQQYPQYGIISPTHLTGSGNKLEQGFSGYTHMESLEEVTAIITGVPIVASFINAAFWMIPVSVLKKIGGFCPLFYHYGEDVDYVNRLHYAGYQIGYSNIVFGYHDREHRQINRKTFLKSEQIYLLTEYANINYSFPKAFAYGILAALKKAILAFLKKDIHTSIAYLSITWYLLGCTFKVTRYRRINLNKEMGNRYIL